MSQYYDLNMTGPELEARLGKVLMNETAIADETLRAQGIEATKANASDVYTKAQTDAAIDADVLVEKQRAEAAEAGKANASDVYTKSQTDAAIDADVLVERQRAEAAEAGKANASDVYTKSQTDAAIQTESERAQAAEATKQGVISDLDTIRSGAALGSTALQQHQSLSNYYTKTETAEVVGENVHDAVGMIDTSRLTLSPDVVLPNVGANVTMVATTGSAADITIRDGRHIIAQGTGDELVAVEPFIPTSESYIDIVAEFRAAGITHSVTRRILVVTPIMYGAGLSISSATNAASARKTADGEYHLNVPEGGGYLWFCLPSDMKLSKVLMTDVEMEMELPDNTTMPGYTVYRSHSMYDEGVVTVLLVGSDPYKE